MAAKKVRKGKRKKTVKHKPLNLTSGEKRKIRKYMPPQYKLIAEIIDEARNRRKESLRALGMFEGKSPEIETIPATCPNCGHEFRVQDKSRLEVPSPVRVGV